MNQSYRQQITKLLSQLTNQPYVNKKILNKFFDWINKQSVLTKKEGAVNHISTFFLPVNKASKSIYLVNHIKAELWIPPGGHIEQYELPKETVVREFKEELDYKLTNEKIQLFDLSITPINRPWQNCITHYDFWYLVYTERLPFKFLKKEFHNAGWFNFEEGLKKVTRPSIRNMIKNIVKIL